jgi:RNA polymerase sigma-70 factor (ECF subfamily)
MPIFWVVQNALLALRWAGSARRLQRMKNAVSTSDDVALLLAVARRDETALATLHDGMSCPIFSLVRRIVRSRAEAEEVLQEAFWRIRESAAGFQPQLGSPFCWSGTTARREAIDRLRANARQLQRITEAQAPGVEDGFGAPVGTVKARIRRGLLKLKPSLAGLQPADAN